MPTQSQVVIGRKADQFLPIHNRRVPDDTLMHRKVGVGTPVIIICCFVLQTLVLCEIFNLGLRFNRFCSNGCLGREGRLRRFSAKKRISSSPDPLGKYLQSLRLSDRLSQFHLNLPGNLPPNVRSRIRTQPLKTIKTEIKHDIGVQVRVAVPHDSLRVLNHFHDCRVHIGRFDLFTRTGSGCCFHHRFAAANPPPLASS